MNNKQLPKIEAAIAVVGTYDDEDDAKMPIYYGRILASEYAKLKAELAALKSKHSDCVSREEPEKDIAKSCVEHGTPSSKDGCAKCHWESIVGLQKELATLKTAHSKEIEDKVLLIAEGMGVVKMLSAKLEKSDDELRRAYCELTDSDKVRATYTEAYYKEKDLRSEVRAKQALAEKELALLNKTMRELLPDHKLALKDIVERAVGAEAALKAREEELAEWRQAFPSHERREGPATPKEATAWVDDVCKKKNRLFDDSIHLKQALAEKENAVEMHQRAGESWRSRALHAEQSEGWLKSQATNHEAELAKEKEFRIRAILGLKGNLDALMGINAKLKTELDAAKADKEKIK